MYLDSQQIDVFATIYNVITFYMWQKSGKNLDFLNQDKAMKINHVILAVNYQMCG